jgi:hypothetical protein
MKDLQMSVFVKLTMMPATCPECDMVFSRKEAWNNSVVSTEQ